MEAVISTKCPVLNEKKTKELGVPTNLEVLVVFGRGDWAVPTISKRVLGCPAYDNEKGCKYNHSKCCNYLQE